MPAPKGHRVPNAPRGRRTPNKSTVAAKEAFALAFEGIGGVERLIAWAQEEPAEFFKLYARLIPVEHSGQVAASIQWPLPQHPLERP